MQLLSLPRKIILGLFFYSVIILPFVGIAKSTPHACYAVLKTQQTAQHEYAIHAPTREDARQAVEYFIATNKDPDFDLFDDLEDYYLDRIAIHGSHEDDILSSAAVNARLKNFLKVEETAHYDLSDKGGASLVKINGHVEVQDFLKKLEKSMNDFPFEEVLHQSHKTFLDKVIQKWTALYAGVLFAGISTFTSYIDSWAIPFIGLGIGTYLLEAIKKTKNHKSAGESLQAGNTFKSFINGFKFFSEAKNKAWLSFHADLNVSKKFLEYAAQGKMNEEVFRDEVYRQASLSNAAVALRSWENNQGEAIPIKLDLLLVKNDVGESSLIIGIRTLQSDITMNGGRRFRTPTPETIHTSVFDPILTTP